jgi:hypothetical protein
MINGKLALLGFCITSLVFEPSAPELSYVVRGSFVESFHSRKDVRLN